MQINRHNYEEFFILYLDNELSSEDRGQVELFVQENPDLKAELDLLLQSQLSPDASVIFDNKDLLLRRADTGAITISNYEEWLLSSLDDELSPQQRVELENFISANPSVQKEFNQLQLAKLTPDTSVVFRNKEILYREEEKVRVIGFNWKRIAIAAGLLLAVSTTALLVYNDRDANLPPVVAETKEVPAIQVPTPANEEKNVSLPVEKATVETSIEANNNEKKLIEGNIVETSKTPTPVKQKNVRDLNATPQQNQPVLAETKDKKETNNLPQPVNNPYVNKEIRDNPIAMVSPVTKDALTNIKETKSLPVVTPHTAQPLDNVETAALIEPIDDEQPGRKNKLRGFFRKVTRTFEKTTNIKATDDEDRLLLGGLAIKL